MLPQSCEVCLSLILLLLYDNVVENETISFWQLAQISEVPVGSHDLKELVSCVVRHRLTTHSGCSVTRSPLNLRIAMGSPAGMSRSHSLHR